MLYAIVTGGTWAGDAAPEIGTAVLIKNEVVATLGDNKRDLREGVRVHRTEYLQTGDSAQAELKLDDQTKLALGPNAGLKLDEFVIGKSGGVTTIGVNFVKGTFRFITGAQKKDAYVIETPSATIGVRGTVFDVYVDGSWRYARVAAPGRGQHLQQDEKLPAPQFGWTHHSRKHRRYPFRSDQVFREVDPRPCEVWELRSPLLAKR